MRPSVPIVHSSCPLIRTDLPVPPWPVFVPVQIHRKIAWIPSLRTSSNFTTMSGNAFMNPWAVAVIAARPTEGAPALTVSEPSSASKAVRLAGFWLLQAAAYRVAKSASSDWFMAIVLGVQFVSVKTTPASSSSTQGWTQLRLGDHEEALHVDVKMIVTMNQRV